MSTSKESNWKAQERNTKSFRQSGLCNISFCYRNSNLKFQSHYKVRHEDTSLNSVLSRCMHNLFRPGRQIGILKIIILAQSYLHEQLATRPGRHPPLLSLLILLFFLLVCTKFLHPQPLLLSFLSLSRDDPLQCSIATIFIFIQSQFLKMFPLQQLPRYYTSVFHGEKFYISTFKK